MASRKMTEVSHGGSPISKGQSSNGGRMGNITTSSPTSASSTTGEFAGEGEAAEEADHSANGKRSININEPDVHALPGVQLDGVQAASNRLAGQLQLQVGDEAGSRLQTPTALSVSKSLANTDPADADSPLSDITMEEAEEDQAVARASKDYQDSVEDDEAYEGLDGASDSGDSLMDEEDLEESAEKELAKMYERREARRITKAIFSGEEEVEPASQASQDAGETAVEETEEDAEPDFDEDPFGGLDANTAMELFPYDKEQDPLGLSVGLDDDDFSFTDQLDDWRRDDLDGDRRESQQSTTQPKRVRFEDDVFATASRSSSFSSNSEDEQDPNDAFPDLFMSQDDPLMQQRLAMVKQEDAAADRDFNADNHSDAGSYWDFDDEEKMAFEMAQQSESDDSSSSSSDDDSDNGGDTTDEETEESQQMSIQVAIANSKRSSPTKTTRSAPGTPAPTRRTLNRPSRSSSTSRISNARMGKPPPVGTFVVDSKRARMYSRFNNGRSSIVIEPPSRPANEDKALWQRHNSVMSSRHNSPRNSMSWDGSTPSLDDMPARPFTAHSTLGTMFNGNLDILRNNDHIGLTDDVFSAPVTRASSLIPGADYASETEDESEEELNLADFMHYSDSDTEDEADDPAPSGLTSPTLADTPLFSSGLDSPAPTPATPGSTTLPSSPAMSRTTATPAPGLQTDLLTHLDRSRGIVGSFRRNQHRAKQIGSLASHPSLRASTSELNALQKGRRGAANMPMTPARKKRASQDLTPRGSTSGGGGGIRKPFTGPAASPLSKHSPRRRGQSLSSVFSPKRTDIKRAQ